MFSVFNPIPYDRGFTLIELLIVIAIILILIAIALPNFIEAQIRAKVAKAAGDTRSLATAMESYFIDWNSYTNDCPGPELPGCIALTTPIAYMTSVPLDPFGLHRNQGGSIVDIRNGRTPFYPMGTGINPSTELKIIPYDTSSGFNRDNPPIKEAYIIYTGGPSDLEPGDPTGPFPVSGAGLPWTVYTPTNGTKSFGGIIVTGGVSLEHPTLKILNQLTHL